MPCVYVELKEAQPAKPTERTVPTEHTGQTKPQQTGVPETQLLELAVGAAIVGGVLYYLLKR